jgi:hypothetical protein
MLSNALKSIERAKGLTALMGAFQNLLSMKILKNCLRGILLFIKLIVMAGFFFNLCE